MIPALQDLLRQSRRVLPTGARTKPALTAVPEDVVLVDLTAHRGIVEYEPGEFTFTARAGTPLREIQEALAAHGQYLPWDPPLAAAGATLGGTVAAGLNGPGRLRFGGLRDFILGVEFLLPDGSLHHGGGKVVKNAAGFDYPKLLAGSLGRLAILTELTFKVFPAPQSRLSATLAAGSLAAALDLACRLARSVHDLDALDFFPDGRLLIRLAGDEGTLQPRLDRLRREAASAAVEAVSGTEWDALQLLKWVKVPVTAGVIPALDADLAKAGLDRRYSVAGNLAWIAPGPVLGEILHRHALPGLALEGPSPCLGPWPAVPERLRAVFDAEGKFPGV